MLNDTLPPPIWVDTPTALNHLAAQLSREARIAVDTESNSLHAYTERVCLMQFSTPHNDYLLDTLSVQDLGPLHAIFANPSIEKIFHDADYDIACLQRDFGLELHNLFDTKHAAYILGYKQVGLGNLLNEKFAITLNKKFQKANWAERPLNAEMLNYARMDTHYLFALRDLLEGELHERERMPFAAEDFSRLSAGHANNGEERDPRPRWERIAAQKKLNGRQTALLAALCDWRERTAQRMDRPVFKVVSDDTLLAIARKAPRTAEELLEAELTQRQVEVFGNGILQALREGNAAPIPQPTPITRKSEAEVLRIEKLKTWRKKAAEKMGVESDVILARPHLLAIAAQNPSTLATLQTIMQDAPHRFSLFGADILSALHAKGS